MAQEPEPTPALPRPLLVVAVGLPALLAAGVAAAGLFFGAGVKDDPVAWGDAEHDPVVLRCGLDRPAELKPDSQLRSISDVQWIEVSEGGSTTWFVVDRPVYVALTVPSDSGTGPLQDVSTTVRDSLAARQVDAVGPS